MSKIAHPEPLPKGIDTLAHRWLDLDASQISKKGINVNVVHNTASLKPL
jgi:hypothetical protein